MDANQAWIAVFRQIPSELHDVLALGITTGAEIVVQKIVKLEPDFMIIRGRLAGTQDTGRLIVVPYNQLTFLAIIRDLKDNQIDAMFGKGAAVAQVALPAAEDAPAVDTEEPADDTPKTTKKPEAVSKTVLLAKLRGRLKEGGK